MADAAPYGSWQSPIDAALLASSVRGLQDVALDGAAVLWTELRPLEGGRSVAMRWEPDGTLCELTPEGFNARTTVHEYGGGALAVDGGTVYFSNFADQRVYRQDPGRAPEPLTADDARRYADCVVDGARGRLIGVCEDHRRDGEPANAIVALPFGGGDPLPLADGHDFFSTPRLSPAGDRLSWMAWDHPSMPWDVSEVWVANVGRDGTLEGARKVAGGAGESVFQPSWSPDGLLYFVSDRSGWWNLYRERDGEVEAVLRVDADLGQPQWAFGTATFGFLDSDRALVAVCRLGRWELAVLHLESGTLEPVEAGCTEIRSVRANAQQAVFVGGAPEQSAALWRLDAHTGHLTELRRSSTVAVDSGFVARPEAITYPTGGGVTAHAFYYAPRSGYVRGPEGERPPLLVMSHGGPTGAASTALNLRIQYWTSRGIAVVDVNYGGSTGYGRAYRERLQGQWGIVDMEDCVRAAEFLAARGDVDPARLAITGGSAGGYTTLCALTFRDTFRAGASYYGVSDAAALARDTHKFESRYLDGLMGPYPQAAAVYRERSPIDHAERLNCPVIFFQGLEDKVVPPDQAERMVAALRDNGVPVAYITFEGEQHGFRRAENVRRALEAEFAFYGRIFGFTPADDLELPPIENL